MEKRSVPTIGDYTGIKELDNVRQCGSSYNLYDIVKVLGIDKYELKKICDYYDEYERIDDDIYISIFQLKRLLLRYNIRLTDYYMSYVIHNDTELQLYGVCTDHQFRKDNEDTKVLNEINEYKKHGIDLNTNKNKNYLNPIDHDIELIDISDNDYDLIYKLIDEN